MLMGIPFAFRRQVTRELIGRFRPRLTHVLVTDKFDEDPIKRSLNMSTHVPHYILVLVAMENSISSNLP